MEKVIVNGSYQIVDMGSFITYDYNSDIIVNTFISYNEKEIPLRISFEFKSNSDEPQPSATASLEDGNLQITCTNFHGNIGLGVASPIDLQLKDGTKFFLRYWISNLGNQDTSRRIEYTLYTEK